ncbi:MAG: 4-alpha-glucanotransferase, partial [Actinomycetes bacterium]
MDEPTPELTELAHAHGVATEFYDWTGARTVVPASTIVAVLTSLGVEAATTESARVALARARDAPWRRMLPPCVVTRAGAATPFAVHVPHGDPVDVRVELEGGGGRPLGQLDRYVEPRHVGGSLVGEATFQVPGDLPLGWHRVVARSGETSSAAPLVVTPPYVGVPEDLAGQVWGFMTQLYSVRSRSSWGHGDLADLAELCRWSAEQLGAGYLLVNPLHATSPTPPLEASPYLPATRRFVSPLYLRVEDV